MLIERHTESLSCDVPGFTNDEILAFIRDAVIWKKPKHCLEIGTFMGRSAAVICDALAAIGGDHVLTCIDAYTQVYEPDYINTKSKKHMIKRCGPEIAALYSDFDQLKTLEDCFNLTVSRKPAMQTYARLVKGKSATVDYSAITPVDFAYIDGDHSYNGVKTDTINTLSVLNPGGLIIFDDYLERFDGVIRFVDELREFDGVHFAGRASGDIAFVIADPATVRSKIAPAV